MRIRKYLSLFVFLSVIGCHPSMTEPEWDQDILQNAVLTKSGDSINDNDDYGQFPTYNYYGDDSLFPPLTLKNGLTLKPLGDSLYLYDGDIIFCEKDLERLSRDDISTPFNPRSASIITNLSMAYYWPDGIVPFKMDISLPPAYRSTVQSAMSDISAVAPVTFKLISPSSTYSDYIVFKYSSYESNSYVGRQGGPQIVNIKANNKGTAIHEIMHALGFFHEHGRSDRDQNIIINWSNIRPEKWYAFDKYNISRPGIDLGSFDYNSIMLYSSTIRDSAFVYNPDIYTITDLDGHGWSGHSSLSAGDIDGLWMIYGHLARQLTRTTSNYNLYSDATTYCETYLETTTLVFYEDYTYTTPLILTHPAIVNLVRSHSYNNNNQIVTSEEVISMVLPAGYSSYIIDSRPNIIYLINGNPYCYDVTHYTLHN